jgi:hypothetical protein
LDAAREAAKKKVKDIQFDPKQTDLDQPKEGEHDDKEHSGGNKWAGGVSSLFFFSPTRCSYGDFLDWWQRYCRFRRTRGL